MSRVARAAVHAALRRIESGRIELRESFSGAAFGFGPAASALPAEVVGHDPGFYGHLMRDRGIGLGTTYADGQWDSPDVVAALRIGAREVRRSDAARHRMRMLTRPLRRLRPAALRN